MHGFVLFAALNGLASVAIDAAAAHALPQARLDLVATAARYQIVHALALLALAALAQGAGAGRRVLSVAAWAFSAGLVLFCGGLYLRAFAGIASLGPVVPMGGTAFMIGWAALAWSAAAAFTRRGR